MVSLQLIDAYFAYLLAIPFALKMIKGYSLAFSKMLNLMCGRRTTTTAIHNYDWTTMINAIVSAATAISLLGAGVASLPAEPTAYFGDTAVVYSQTAETPESRINYTGTTFLYTGIWTTITTSNNFLPDSPMVSNHSVNSGTIAVRIVNALTHDVICDEMLLGVGSQGRTCRIPALSGEYAVQGMAMSVAGNYLISVD